MIEGRVSERNPRGGMWPAPHATVQVLGTRFATVTDETGRFRFLPLPAGRHHLRVPFSGTRTLDTLIARAEGDTLRLDLVLEELPPGSRVYPLPGKPLLERLGRASVVRVFRCEARRSGTDAAADTSLELGGYHMAAALPRPAEWLREMRRALSRRGSWDTKGPGEVRTDRMVGMRFHDARGYVDVVVFPRERVVSVREDGARPREHHWRGMAPPLAQWLDEPPVRH